MALKFYAQEKDYSCGAAVMRMALEFCGIKKSEKDAANLLGTNKAIGTKNKSFPELAEKFKLNYAVKRNAHIDDLKEYIKKGYFVIVCYFYPEEKIGHYSAVKKIDNKNIYFLDPLFGPEHKYNLNYFKSVWHNNPKQDNEKRWLFAVKK